ncbi:hypothetical protein AX17_001608 [Amanita inopinata Kibby_2008]|nr:hypothetical protein AX17_001608 [Amanita inopinata Kibby_2008]
MKEILYIQAGSLANYTATHFWNTQETYLSFEDPEEPYVQHDVSFREISNGSMGQVTFCPRVLVFDRKANFGALTRVNALGDEDTQVADTDLLWNGNVQEYKHNTIEKSSYHLKLEETDDSGVADAEKDDEQLRLLQDSKEIRYWSDFNRVFYVPKSIQPLPDPIYGEIVYGDWKGGSDLFSRYNQDTSFMDDSVRLFLEECDYFQGLQVINDVETFGGFTNSLLTTFRDEFSKTSSLVIPFLSDALHSLPGITEANARRKILNDALYLRSLSELSSMNIPLQTPSTWPSHPWPHLINFDRLNVYQATAIVSAHLESSTLPLRFAKHREDLSSFCAQASQYTPGPGSFFQLGGCIPVTSSTPFGPRMLFNLSTSDLISDVHIRTRRDVTRGFSSAIMSAYDSWHSHSITRGIVTSSTNAPAYPLPSSYPSIFKNTDFVTSPYRTDPAPTPRVAALSSICATSKTSRMFSAYADFVERCLKSGAIDASVGIDADETRELVNDLWTLHDSYVLDNCMGDEGES